VDYTYCQNGGQRVLIKNRRHNFGWVIHLVLSIICDSGQCLCYNYWYHNVLPWPNDGLIQIPNIWYRWYQGLKEKHWYCQKILIVLILLILFHHWHHLAAYFIQNTSYSKMAPTPKWLLLQNGSYSKTLLSRII
jgi:hypothetical protein